MSRLEPEIPAHREHQLKVLQSMGISPKSKYTYEPECIRFPETDVLNKLLYTVPRNDYMNKYIFFAWFLIYCPIELVHIIYKDLSMRVEQHGPKSSRGAQLVYMLQELENIYQRPEDIFSYLSRKIHEYDDRNDTFIECSMPIHEESLSEMLKDKMGAEKKLLLSRELKSEPLNGVIFQYIAMALALDDDKAVTPMNIVRVYENPSAIRHVFEWMENAGIIKNMSDPRLDKIIRTYDYMNGTLQL